VSSLADSETDPFATDPFEADLSGRTVLLTGATGSFGHAFIGHALLRWPGLVIRAYSRDELKQSELRAAFGDERVRYLIGDIRDQARLTRAAQGVDIIIHAAAMKQVPACEYNPFEAVNTNILGAQHVVDAAIDAGVRQVVALSTDKAVNPVNLYGATKLCMEKIVVQGNAYAARSGTRLACVRYGNVAGSRGSVIPLFLHQRPKGRLTITDERMTRFWITLDEAVGLVTHALGAMRGGEIFIPKIPSVRVTDLAEAIAPEAEHVVVGARPGEKLHETLLTSDEARHSVDAGETYVVLPEHPWWPTDGITGSPLPDGFAYTSDANDRWLGPRELARALPDVLVERRGAAVSWSEPDRSGDGDGDRE
jgi:UDP-N-acetylglucosamine 4,6-dehydratase